MAGYWASWSAPRLRDVPSQFNTVFLFAAHPTGGQPSTDGSVYWRQYNQTHAQLVADIALLRSQGRKVILSVGGSGAAVDISTIARRSAFLSSFRRIADDLGGVDGIDWNIEDDRLIRANIPNAVWVSQELEKADGANFAITTPPAPWRQSDIDFVRALDRAGVLDLVSPQYYDHPGLAVEDDVIDNVRAWVGYLDGDATKVGVGFRNSGPAEHVMPVERSVRIMENLRSTHPNLRGAFIWQIDNDRRTGYRFANEVGDVIRR